MAMTKAPIILVFLADAAITKGQAVMFGSDNRHVVKVTGTTSKSIGIAQTSPTTAEDLVEVAVSGGGAKGLAKTTIAAGDILGHNADASIQKAASANDRVVGVAMSDAAAGDLFNMDVLLGMATQTQS